MIGDSAVYRAKEDIPAGSQITRSYIWRNYESYPERRATLAEYCVGDCMCKLCTDDRSDGNRKIYERLKIEADCDLRVRNSRKLGTSSRARMLQLRVQHEADVAVMEKTYGPHRSRIRPERMHIHCYVRGQCESWRDWSIEIDYLEQSLISHGVVIRYRNEADLEQKRLKYRKTTVPHDLCIMTAPKLADDMATSFIIRLTAMYEIGQNEQRHQEWIKAAYWVETVGFSNSKDWFKEPSLCLFSAA